MEVQSGPIWSWQGQTDRERVHAVLDEWQPLNPRRLQIWVSEGSAGRAALQAELLRRWPDCDVQVSSCFKPLVSALLPLLPAWEKQPPKHLHLLYPVLPDAHPERFLLEAYPLAGWADSRGIQFSSEATETGQAAYTLLLDGQALRVPVPVRPIATLMGETVQRMTGRITINDTLSVDFPTAFEELWNAFENWLKAQDWPAQPLYFQTMQMKAQFPAERESLHHAHEALDLTEALSEELYFATLEFFQHRAGLGAGDRTLQPGQIIPVVTAGDEVRLEIRFSPPELTPFGTTSTPSLHDLDRPLTSAEVLNLASAGMEAARSVQGRPIHRFTKGGEGGLLVSAGQHANEPTGVVAALRAVTELLPASPVPMTVIPLENPDGYALGEWLCAEQHPQHMHHAARYTALGDDLEYRQQAPLHERAARNAALLACPPLHVNLHGYPSHEWTRPLHGYVPKGFEAWTLPKGFCLIFRHHPGQTAQAEALAEFVTTQLVQIPDLMRLNAGQLVTFQAHTGARPYRVLNGTPCLFHAREDLDCPLTLITEYPDETVTGPDFRLGQQAQFAVIQAAVTWLQASGE